jgi:hypothetical protein
MSDFDRELIEVNTDIDGDVRELRELVELRGATLVSRVIADGFAEVFQASDEELFRPLPLAAGLDRQWHYLTTEEALQAARQHRIPDDYRNCGGTRRDEPARGPRSRSPLRRRRPGGRRRGTSDPWGTAQAVGAAAAGVSEAPAKVDLTCR